MDHFGIGAALRAVAEIYFRSARQTGRTASLVDSVKDGDRIIFAMPEEAKRVERLLKERDVKVKCVVKSPRDYIHLGDMGTSQGRTVFDHTWVEQFYAAAIDRAGTDIQFLQNELSGYGEPHRETHRRAEELRRWHL